MTDQRKEMAEVAVRKTETCAVRARSDNRGGSSMLLVKVRRCALATLLSGTLILQPALRAHAGEFDTFKGNLLAARTNDDMVRIYQSINRELHGNTTKIVAFLKDVGFSCQYGTVLFKAKCVLAYCGDRTIFQPLERSLFPPFRRELMSKGITITERGVQTSVIGHQSACPSVSLKEIQKKLLN